MPNMEEAQGACLPNMDEAQGSCLPTSMDKALAMHNLSAYEVEGRRRSGFKDNISYKSNEISLGCASKTTLWGERELDLSGASNIFLCYTAPRRKPCGHKLQFT